ncbi:MAG: hypothetical protein GY757_22960 [bacterium]|nr:hypothetical protein [bacterium]
MFLAINDLEIAFFCHGNNSEIVPSAPWAASYSIAGFGNNDLLPVTFAA